MKLFVIGKGPGGQGTMLKAPAPIVPHQLHFGTSQRGTAASAGKGFFERVWEAKARTVRYLDFGTGGKEPGGGCLTRHSPQLSLNRLSRGLPVAICQPSPLPLPRPAVHGQPRGAVRRWRA